MMKSYSSARTRRVGEAKATRNGTKYLHNAVFLNPYTQYRISEISKGFGLDENHVIGLIVEQFIESGSYLNMDRIDFHKAVTLAGRAPEERIPENGGLPLDA